MQGPGPSARYAHTLALVANRFLVAMGGNDGKQTLSDAWALDTSDKPYQWRKITDAGETPSPRWIYPSVSHWVYRVLGTDPCLLMLVDKATGCYCTHPGKRLLLGVIILTAPTG